VVRRAAAGPPPRDAVERGGGALPAAGPASVPDRTARFDAQFLLRRDRAVFAVDDAGGAGDRRVASANRAGAAALGRGHRRAGNAERPGRLRLREPGRSIPRSGAGGAVVRGDWAGTPP